MSNVLCELRNECKLLMKVSRKSSKRRPDLNFAGYTRFFFPLAKRMGTSTLLVRGWSPENKDRRKQREFETQGERHVARSGRCEACMKAIEAREAGKAAGPYRAA